MVNGKDVVVKKEDVETQVQTWQQLRTVAEAMIKTGFLPPTLKTPEQVIMVIMTGRELNVPMMESLRGINVISQKPAVAPQLMLGMINRSGELEDMAIDDNEPGQVTVTMKRKGKTAYTVSFGENEAKMMGLLYKDNYKKQPMNMYKWRAISACARVVFPDVIGGLYLPEEIISHTDIEEQMGTIDKTAQIAEKSENYDEFVEEFFAQTEAEIEAMKEPYDIKQWEKGHQQEIGMLIDKDRQRLKLDLDAKFNELAKGAPEEEKEEKKEEKKEDRKALNLREYMDLAKQCKDIKGLREWFKSVQEYAEKDLNDADFQALIDDLKRTRNQFLVTKPDDKKNADGAAQLSDYLREALDMKELEHRLGETAKERTALPKALRTWLNTEIEGIRKGLEDK